MLKRKKEEIKHCCCFKPLSFRVVFVVVAVVCFCSKRKLIHLPTKSLPEFVVVHTVKGFGIVNKAEVDIFLEISCFFSDPTDVGNLISGSSAFSNSSLNIWKFTVHILLKPGLENFEYYFTSV